MKIWMIEVQNGAGNWIPMYQPCYSREEAEKKLRQKQKFLPLTTFRAREYEPTFGGDEIL